MPPLPRFKSDVDVAALNHLRALLPNWLPQGKLVGSEWVESRPVGVWGVARALKVNINTGAWTNSSTGHRGEGVVDLFAHINGITAKEAARYLRNLLGIST